MCHKVGVVFVGDDAFIVPKVIQLTFEILRFFGTMRASSPTMI
jgi:hypothetical protein